MKTTTIASVGLTWLARMRWGAFLAETMAILVARFALGIELRLGPLLALVGITALTNFAFEVHTRFRGDPPAWVPGTLLTLDTLTLTGLLHLAGGPSNPFSALYLVHVTLAAVLLGPRWTWAIVVVACASYGLLFVDGIGGVSETSGSAGSASAHATHAMNAMHGHDMHAMHGGDAHSSGAMHGTHGMHDMHAMHGSGAGGSGYEGHLYGMFVAFAVSAALIAFFVTRVREALRAREDELALVRERASRSEHLASLATLAAGAAHELGTPLATIAVVAKELERSLATFPDGDSLSDDAKLVREEVARCRTILDRMAMRAGQPAGEAPETLDLRVVVRGVRDSLSRELAARVDVDVPAAKIHAPPHALETIVENLVRNALDASSAHVRVHAEERGRSLAIAVEDTGSGMDAVTLARATEPFFTTKETGKGMGLGLFLASSLADRLGGTLAFESRLGVGTTVTLTLPRNESAP